MKSSELFDILGQIDDKFFEEARQPDAQQGELIVAESRPFRSFMSIFAPIAACVAIIVAVVIGANFISKNAGIVKPNDSDSTSDATLSSDSSTVSNNESSVSTPESDSSVPPVDDGKIHLEDYPPINLETVPNIQEGGLGAVMGNYELLDKATLATLKCGDYELYMLGRSIHIDTSSEPYPLYSYDMTLAVVKDGEVISSDGPHTFSVSMGQGGYQLVAFDLNNYLEYYELNGGNLIVFQYHKPGQDEMWDYECTFFTITEDGELRFLMGDTSGIGGDSIGIAAYLNAYYTVDSENNTLTDGDVVYKFNCENFGLNPYDAIHYTAEMNIDLSEYPLLDMSQVPDSAEITNWDQCLPKATLAEKRVGYYTLSLIGELIRSPKQVNPNTILADKVRTVVSHNGKIIYTSEPDFKECDIHYLEYELMPAYEMNYGVVFLIDHGYYRIRGDHMVKFYGDYSAIEGVDPPDDYDPYTSEVIELPTENALILNGAEKYTFDFNTDTFAVSYTGDEPFVFAEYMIYDKDRKNAQPKVILEEKEAGGYKFYLLGNNVRNVDNHYDLPDITISEFKFTKLIVAVEKDGKIIDHIEAFTTNIKNWETDLIGQYLRPFEMKDGTGFVMYATLRMQGLNTGNTYAMIYKVENDTITQLKYEFDNAPAPATGSPHYVGRDFTVDPENNAIVYEDYYGEEVTLTIDFANNMFSES